MSKFNYERVLVETQTEVENSGMAPDAARALDEVLKLSHPERELAFLDWALSSRMCGGSKVNGPKKRPLDQLSI